jgi:hypothetical protein
MSQRIAAAKAAGIGTIYAPMEGTKHSGVTLRPVSHIREALHWARRSGGPGAESEDEPQ